MDHAVTQLALSPDKRSLVLVVDDCTALTMSSVEEDCTCRKAFTFGLNVNGLSIVDKSSDMFDTNNAASKILIKRLNFTLDDHDSMKEIDSEIQMARSNKTNCDFNIYREKRAGHDEDVEGNKLKNLQKSIVSCLK